MEHYTTQFKARGADYDRAMKKNIEARRDEFLQAIERASLSSGMVVADVPAGGGYLQQFLPKGCRWMGHEPCQSFQGEAHGEPVPFLPLPWPSGSIDVVFSIAGLHHVDDLRPLLGELRRVLRRDGQLVISDVLSGSLQAHFLDNYVGSHNGTGHAGKYLGAHTLSLLKQEGWLSLRHEQVDYYWRFADESAMASFCHTLFGLQNHPDETRDAIEKYLGVDELESGELGMRWSLFTIVARPAF